MNESRQVHRAEQRRLNKTVSAKLDKRSKSFSEKLTRRFSFASYSQLIKWQSRVAKRGNHILDCFDENSSKCSPKKIAVFRNNIAIFDALGVAITSEIHRRVPAPGGNELCPSA